MSKRPSVELLPALCSLNPDEVRPQCIYWLVDKDRRCSRRLNPHYRVRQYLGDNPSRLTTSAITDCTTLAEDLVGSLSCSQHEKILHKDTVLGKQLRARWTEELKSVTKREVVTHGDDLSTMPASFSPCSTPPRRSTRLTVQTPDQQLVPLESASALEFVPMKKTSMTLMNKLLKGPTERQRTKITDLYAFSRKSSPGMLKIGYANNVHARLARWSKCGYTPVLQHHLRNIPLGRFVEKLVHFELLQHWRRELQCNWGKGCERQHEEWFEIEERTAFRVMDNWANWVALDPYDEGGSLRLHWHAAIKKLVATRTEVTAEALLSLNKPTIRSVPVHPPQVKSEHSPASLPAVPLALATTQGIAALATLIISLSRAEQDHLVALLSQAQCASPGSFPSRTMVSAVAA
jgi:hypothetical protein